MHIMGGASIIQQALASAADVPALLRFTGTTLEGKAFDGAGLAGRPVVF